MNLSLHDHSWLDLVSSSVTIVAVAAASIFVVAYNGKAERITLVLLLDFHL